MRRELLGLLGLLLCFVSFGARPAGQSDAGVRVRSLAINGASSIDTSRLRAALATRVSSRLPWGRRAELDRSRLAADVRRVEAFYADQGFPDARVRDVNVVLNDRQDTADITLTVEEGQPVIVAALDFLAFDSVPSDRLATVRTSAPLKVGAPRVRQQVVATRDLALNELREQGYAYARVVVEEDDGPTGKVARIAFKAEPGPLAHFGAVEVVGNRSVNEQLIRRQLRFGPGDRYRRSLVQDSQRRLYRLELFQFVNIESLDTDRQSPELRTRVNVVEGNHQRVNFGVGYGTEEKGRLEGQYHHVNFLGGARSAGAHARWSSLDRGVRLDFIQPYFVHPTQSLGVDAQRWWTDTPAYQSLVTGAKFTFTRRPNQRMSWAVSWASEQNTTRVSDLALADPRSRELLILNGVDPSTRRQEGTVNALGFDYQRSTADSVLDATRGYQVAFHAERAGIWLPGTFDYVAVSGDGRHYLPLGRRFVLASRLQFGNLVAADEDPSNVPFAKKYFLGGASNLRGWGRFEVSPLDGSGLPIGGNAFLAFSSELRAPLSGASGGVLFLDGGSVWPELRRADLGGLRYSAGAGLRYRTPVGPIRFDVGYQLNPLPGLQIGGAPQLRRWRMHFSIGQAF